MKVKTIATLLLLFVFVSGCQQQVKTPEIPLYTSKAEAAATREGINQPKKIRIALASVLSPQASLSKYKDLLDYIGSQMELPIEIIQKQSYQEVDRMLKAGEVDIAFICSLSYVLGLKDQYLVNVAAPEINGRAMYHSYTIVNQSSSYESLEELKGKKFAYTDPYSYTGRLSILSELYNSGYSSNDFFSNTFFTYSHDYSVNAVQLGIVDGATVDGVLLDQLLNEKPELNAQIRIIGMGEEAGTPPVVASKKADSQIVKEFSEILLNLQSDRKGTKLLEELGVERYAPINERDYEVIKKGLFLLGETS